MTSKTPQNKAAANSGSSTKHIVTLLTVFAGILIARSYFAGEPVLELLDPRNWGSFSVSSR